MSIKIKFEGTEYWFIGDSLDESGAIAPLEHCDREGQILPEKCYGPSFAHYYPHSDTINRFGQIIGKRKDLEIIN